MNRLQDKYLKDVVPSLKKDYKNVCQVPKLEKVVLNMGVGEATQNKALLDGAVKDMTLITGRKPVVTKARKSISNFKLREGMPIGCKVTLRGEAMYEFVDRLISIVLPKLKDFRGIPSKSFDGRGNYALGLQEQVIFPEIDYDKVDSVRGLSIVVCTTSGTNEGAFKLLSGLGFPFKKN